VPGVFYRSLKDDATPNARVATGQGGRQPEALRCLSRTPAPALGAARLKDKAATHCVGGALTYSYNHHGCAKGLAAPPARSMLITRVAISTLHAPVRLKEERRWLSRSLGTYTPWLLQVAGEAMVRCEHFDNAAASASGGEHGVACQAEFYSGLSRDSSGPEGRHFYEVRPGDQGDRSASDKGASLPVAGGRSQTLLDQGPHHALVDGRSVRQHDLEGELLGPGAQASE
jgi:hypothetical protein